MSDLKIKYGGSAAFTITLASLANSAAPSTAGRQSTVIDNTGNLYLDAHVGGKITAGSNTAGSFIEVFAFAAIEDAGPTYPDALGAADGAVTFTNRDILLASMVLLDKLLVDGTANRAFWMKPASVAAAFGGWLPFKWGICVINGSGGTLNATGGNHALYYKPVYAQTA